MAYIFLSYAHEDFDIAQKLYFALSNIKHQVFFDKQSLQVGEEYNFTIIDSIRKSDFCIILLSPEYFSVNSYCRTELKIIQSNWAIPRGKVLPVIVREIPVSELPNYLSSVTILKSQGNLIAEVVQAVQDQLLGFKTTDSVSIKIRRLEIEKQIDEIDLEWAEKKKQFLIAVNNKQVTPSNELAYLISIIFLFFSAFGYFVFTRADIEFFGILPALIPFVFSFISFFYIKDKAAKFKDAETYYMHKRSQIYNEIPSDGVDYLAMYR